MNPSTLYTITDPNPRIDYVAYREISKERKAPDYFAKVAGCKNGLKAWSTGSGPTADQALSDALRNWETEGR